MVKNLPANAGATGSVPASEDATAVEQLSLCTTTTEACVP